MDSLENTENSSRMQRVIILSVLAYIMWAVIFAPPAVQQTTEAQLGDTGQQPALVVETSKETPKANNFSAPVEEKKQRISIPAHKEAFVDDELEAEISSHNGSIRSAVFKKYSELPTNNPWWSSISSESNEAWTPYLTGKEKLPIISEHGSLISAGVGRPSLGEAYQVRSLDNSVQAIGSLGGLTIEKTYEKTDIPYVYRVNVRFINNTGRPQQPWIGISDKLNPEDTRFYDALRPQYYTDGIEYHLDLEDIQESSKREEISPYWFGLGSRYFLVAASEFSNQTKVVNSKLSSVEPYYFDNEEYGSVAYFADPLEDGKEESISLTLYVGPKKLDDLRVLSDEWSQAVDFGFFGFFSRVLLFILTIIYSGVQNWGIAIILLTVVVKVIFFPMTQKAFESGRKMQMIQPELAAVKEKFKDDQMLQSQETMKLFKKHGVSPLGGCLPTLIQMPVWFALYNSLLYSVELYDSSFLYLQDLTSPDPYGVLPVMYGILMFASQTLMKPATQGPVNEQQAMMMKMMKAMTVVFTFFMFTFPSGLVIYFCCNMFLSTVQQVLIKKRLETTMMIPVSEKG